ncbi:hypothetical protein [Candidatus Nitrosocosmicus hydrocola]|uniref:hypothetical protein n=1 Tax=Candidatus Nitrosocosmicus hydrocola TaxID=1826872 RepID=UPI0011E5D2FC|nr:hypothetical protein [Candidatus Nitrosocosmicus hydrocola]
MNKDNSNTSNPTKRFMSIESQFKSLVKNIREGFPHVDEYLVLDILRIEHFKPNWQGTTTIEIQYRKDSVNLQEQRIDFMKNLRCFLWKRMKELRVLRQKGCICKILKSSLRMIRT